MAEVAKGRPVVGGVEVDRECRRCGATVIRVEVGFSGFPEDEDTGPVAVCANGCRLPMELNPPSPTPIPLPLPKVIHVDPDVFGVIRRHRDQANERLERAGESQRLTDGDAVRSLIGLRRPNGGD